MRALLLISVALLVAAPCWAIDTTKYPHTLVDQTCTDDFDTPAAETLALAYFDRTNTAATVQATGSGDGFCDHDSRIVTGAITIDAVFGPFSGKGIRGIVAFLDADTVVGGAPTFRILSIRSAPPQGGSTGSYHQSSLESGTGNYIVVYGSDAGSASAADESVALQVPDIFSLALDLVGSTSITADYSVVTY